MPVWENSHWDKGKYANHYRERESLLCPGDLKKKNNLVLLYSAQWIVFGWIEEQS